MTCLRTPAASAPDGRLPGRGGESAGLAVDGVEDVDGLEAVAVIMGVEQRQPLAAVDGVGSIVDIEDDAARS